MMFASVNMIHFGGTFIQMSFDLLKYAQQKSSTLLFNVIGGSIYVNFNNILTSKALFGPSSKNSLMFFQVKTSLIKYFSR